MCAVSNACSCLSSSAWLLGCAPGHSKGKQTDSNKWCSVKARHQQGGHAVQKVARAWISTGSIRAGTQMQDAAAPVQSLGICITNCLACGSQQFSRSHTLSRLSGMSPSTIAALYVARCVILALTLCPGSVQHNGLCCARHVRSQAFALHSLVLGGLKVCGFRCEQLYSLSLRRKVLAVQALQLLPRPALGLCAAAACATDRASPFIQVLVF